EQADGTSERQPTTEVRRLSTVPSRWVRESAWHAELDAWETVAVPLAAALNGAKGETVVLNRRRGWPDALATALFTSNVDRETVDVMNAAVVDSLPEFRRYLRAKQQLLHGGDGSAGIAWFDLLAPVGATD